MWLYIEPLDPTNQTHQCDKKDGHLQEYHSDGHKEAKDLEADHLEDHQEEAEDHPEVGGRQEELLCPCHRHPNQEGITGTN
jgi:hypothetical protein